ncbi:odorant receptor Or1-like [Anoplophora glabripennis]|uniref:odorant receptor Or1-like n=1 Tax=Anoplophora glabripennis TaxID=217634 RepID=UPI000A1321B3|nr:odorant receptor Or1-like [Anoplophora glabripennis]
MSSEDLVQRTFKYNIAIMKIFGLYPFDSWPEIYKLYSFIFYLVFTFITPALIVVLLVVRAEESIQIIRQDGFMMVELITLTMKMLPCKVNPEGTRRTMYALKQRIFNSQLPEQDWILAETVDNCRFVFLTYCTSCVFTVLCWACVPLVYEVRRFPITVWLPFDPFENTPIYFSLYIFLVLVVVNAGVDNICVDTLLAFQVYHAASQIKILKDTLAHLGERAEEQILKEGKSLSLEDKDNLKNNIIYKKICHCVDHYEAIYKFVEDLETTYSFIVFSQMIATIVVICICCLRFTVDIPFTMPFFGTATFTAAALIEIFLYCYSGTLLYEESNSVINAIYMSEWYTYDEKSKKALLTLMERAKRPIKVTAGKLLDLSLATFTAIIRRSYSLLAVLKNY